MLGIFFHDFLSLSFYGGDHSFSILLVFLILGIDSFSALPFARLRLQNRPIQFGIIKLVNIGANIFFNLLFLLVVPYLIKNQFISKGFSDFYSGFDGVFFVFLSNALSSLITLFFLLPQLFHLRSFVDFKVIKPVLIYSLPVLFVGITGMLTQNIDKILLPVLLTDDGFSQLAVYGANFKIGILMSLFTQSFRFAFEPFFFKNKGEGKQVYATVMNYFIFFGLVIFLGVTLFIDVINIVLTSEYIQGNSIIPIVLISLLFYGIYFNLSLWYKLTDRTWVGAIFGAVGAVLTIGLNILLVPSMGILGSAVSLLCGYFLMMVLSGYFGRKYYPIPYQVNLYLVYFSMAGLVFWIDSAVIIHNNFFSYLFKAVIFALFIGSFFVIRRYDKSKIN
ncbi:lipopolysaccharide biosynthesis protein [Marinilabilia salmonicolor]|uniref:lipopolysaccharide biosynthesis protein n=1 Tax=Marinilabilia salmonicolor TaxID=989 RepID=UPI001F4769C2|nr:polysaccharide biosynthesis C-terminal domain-containing protein [Marinilabilia salmonicolor]